MASPRNDASDQVNKAANAGRDAADETARTARTIADEAARVGEQTARAGTDIANRSTETARDAFQVSLNTANESFRRMSDQFTRVWGFNGPQAEELARRSSQNVQAVTQASTVLARGTQEASQALIELIQDRVTKNVEAASQILGSRSMQDLVANQSDLVRDNLQQVIDTNRRIAELMVRIADEAGRIIQAQANQNAHQVRRVA